MIKVIIKRPDEKVGHVTHINNTLNNLQKSVGGYIETVPLGIRDAIMTQYCRYCSFCIYGDVPYCTDHDEVLSDRKIRQVNHCKDFDLSPLGDVITGRPYTPRRGKPIQPDEVEQLCMRLEYE